MSSDYCCSSQNSELANLLIHATVGLSGAFMDSRTLKLPVIVFCLFDDEPSQIYVLPIRYANLFYCELEVSQKKLCMCITSPCDTFRCQLKDDNKDNFHGTQLVLCLFNTNIS